MSKEATGSNGAILGSSDYWDRLNRSTFFGDIMSSSSGTDYYRTLEKAGEKAQGAIEEIYQDLSDNGRFLHMLPSSNRDSLAKQVLALYDVCRMTGLSAMRSDDCANGLNLSCMSPWSNPFRDESAIQSAISLIKSNPYYSSNEALNLVREAADWGISFAAGSDERKRTLLETLAQGKNDAFLRDVADEYENENGSKDYCGKCGYSIGSSGYLNAIESEGFGKSLPMTYSAAWGSSDYEGLLRDGIHMITEQLECDLDDASRENYYITDETARKLKDAVSELSRCGVSTFSLESKIEKLAWFVGGDSAKILRLQRDLNELGFGRLTEDGVYGKKTENALYALLERLHNKAEDYLASRSNLELLDRIAWACNASPFPASSITAALLQNRKSIQRMIWKTGADLYLRKRGCDISASFLEHALETSPSNLYFSNWSREAMAVKNSPDVQEKINELTLKISRDSYNEDISGDFSVNFETHGPRDLFLSIGNVRITYQCMQRYGDTLISFELSDTYDFSEIRTIYVDTAESEFGLNLSVGTLANDAGLLSQADGVLTPFSFTITFEVSVPRNQEVVFV